MSDENDAPGWFYVDQNREKQGPFPALEFKALADEGTLLPETLVWSEGHPSWLPASELPGLLPESAFTDKTLPSNTDTAPKEKPTASQQISNLLPDEDLKPRKPSFLFSRIVGGFICCLVLAIISGLAAHSGELSPFLGLAAFTLFPIFVFNALVAFRKENYQLRQSTVICHRGGLVSDQTSEVEISNITHVAMTLPWLRHKFFGIGTIKIESAGTSQAIMLRSIRDPHGVYDRLTERMKDNGYQLTQAELLHEERPAIRGILGKMLSAIIGIGFTIFILYFGTETSNESPQETTGDQSALLIPAITAIASSIIGLIFYFLKMRRRFYRVYNDVVVYEENFLTRRKAFIPSENIADASITRTFLDKIINLYDVVISCQGSATEIKFHRLKNGLHLTECIDRLVTEASGRPSPNEIVATNATNNGHSEHAPLTSRKEPLLVTPGQEWVADLKMSPLRVFLPLLLLLPLFPLWVLAMIQASIKLFSTKYQVRESSIKHSFRFLSTVEREFAYDKVTGLVIKQNLFDRMLGTFTLRFWSIGSSQSLELAHVHHSTVDLEALLLQIGIPQEVANTHQVPTHFGIGTWLRSRCVGLTFALLITIGLVAAGLHYQENALALSAIIIPLLCLFRFSYDKLYFSRQRLTLNDHHLQAEQGILAKRSYYIRYRNIKKNLTTNYPGGQAGSLQIFVAGEQLITQNKGQQQQQQKTIIPYSFTLGFLPEVVTQGQLLDDILSGRVEVTSESIPAEPLALVTESRRSPGNSVFSLVVWSLILFPLLILLPLTLPLTIWAKKRWRYRVEAGRMVVSWGILFKKQATILLDRVDSLEQRQGFLNKIFKNGTVSIMTAGSSKPDLVMPAIKSHQGFYKEVRQLSQKR